MWSFRVTNVPIDTNRHTTTRLQLDCVKESAGDIGGRGKRAGGAISRRLRAFRLHARRGRAGPAAARPWLLPRTLPMWSVKLAGAFSPYDRDVSAKIEESFQKDNSGECCITLRGTDYTIDFQTMKQRQTSDKSKVRGVKRTATTPAPAPAQAPAPAPAPAPVLAPMPTLAPTPKPWPARPRLAFVRSGSKVSS